MDPKLAETPAGVVYSMPLFTFPVQLHVINQLISKKGSTPQFGPSFGTRPK